MDHTRTADEAASAMQQPRTQQQSDDDEAAAKWSGDDEGGNAARSSSESRRQRTDEDEQTRQACVSVRSLCCSFPLVLCAVLPLAPCVLLVCVLCCLTSSHLLRGEGAAGASRLLDVERSSAASHAQRVRVLVTTTEREGTLGLQQHTTQRTSEHNPHSARTDEGAATPATSARRRRRQERGGEAGHSTGAAIAPRTIFAAWSAEGGKGCLD